MTPRVSVVVPAYNSVGFLAATVDSILGQTFTDFELIISDHSSSDGSWELLQRYADEPRVTLTRQPAGGGAAANWNAVTAAATGEYVKLVCSDDLLYPHALAEQVAALDAHPGAVLAAARRDIVDARGEVLIKSRGLQGIEGPISGTAAIRRSVRAGTNVFGEPACVLIRRSVLADEGNWDANYSYLIDQASYARVLAHGDLVPVFEPLAGFRVSDQQWSVRLARSQFAEVQGYHRTIAAAHPGLLSRADLLVGDAMAWVNALGRRLVYFGLRRRLRSTPR